MSHATYLNLISGKTPGLAGASARLGLAALSCPYSAIVRLRNHGYSSGRLKAHAVDATVICVGNLTTGGTGKTPLVVWLCRHIRDRQLRCAVLTRGYKMHGGGLSDEPALLAAECPEVPVIVNPDRVAGAAEAIRSHGAQVLVMDDGFQHRRLARDLDIVTIDATCPFGYGKLLPAGLLREPVAGLSRAHAVALTRCDHVSGETLQQIEGLIHRASAELVIVRSVHRAVRIETERGEEIHLDAIKGKKVFAFCGLGNPQAFFQTVEFLGAVLVGTKAFDDHYGYSSQDLIAMRHQAHERQAGLILTTHKDWTKIARLAVSDDQPPLAYLAVELQITAGADSLTALIDGVLRGRITRL